MYIITEPVASSTIYEVTDHVLTFLDQCLFSIQFELPINDTSEEMSDKECSTNPDPELDFFSENFNPLKALRAANLKVPVKARAYDNLSKYDSVHNKGLPLVSERKDKKDVEPEVVERRWLEHQREFDSFCFFFLILGLCVV